MDLDTGVKFRSISLKGSNAPIHAQASQCDDLDENFESLKHRKAEATPRNPGLVESLSRITNDVQVLRDQNASLELSVWI